jgi:hypothetical protein
MTSVDPSQKIIFSINLTPHQPKIIPYPPNYTKGQHMMSLTYYIKFQWIEYSTITHSAYCFYCRLFCCNRGTGKFVTKGFNTWKMAYTRLQDHHCSPDHKFAHERYIQAVAIFNKKAKPVSIQINSQFSKKVERNRSYLRTILMALYYCSKQGISLEQFTKS